MTFFEQSVFFGVSVSLAAYGIGVLLQKKFKFALFNPLLISVVDKKYKIKYLQAIQYITTQPSHFYHFHDKTRAVRKPSLGTILYSFE